MTDEKTKHAQIHELIRQKGLVSRADLREAGLPEAYLSRMSSQGQLLALASGVYANPDAELDERFGLAIVAKQVPHAVILGPNTLMFHEVTTQLAHTVHLP